MTALLEAGTRLGPYEILALLGAGGMGEVYRGRDSRLQRDVAIKVLPKHLADTPEALVRLNREARAVAALSHENILSIHDIGSEGGVVYLVMELLTGETLRSRIAESPRPWREAAEIGLAVARGLAAAHAKGIVHRDLKPDNVFLTDDGRVKILDFGLARMRPSAGAESVRTEAGTLMGTLGYMSPEQVQGDEVEPASDIFALGCLLYEMIAGRPAFARGTPAETIAAILSSNPPPLATSGVEIPASFQRVVARCLEKDPRERLGSASDVASALRDVLGDAQGPRSAFIGRFSRPRATAIVAIGGLLVLAGLGVYWITGRGQRAHPIDSIAILPW